VRGAFLRHLLRGFERLQRCERLLQVRAE